MRITKRDVTYIVLSVYLLTLIHRYAYGMCEEALQQVFRSVIISEICHASSAWWGFTSATDRQHLKAFLRRSVRSRLCPPDLSDLTELVEAADDKLFQLILRDNHILSSLLPPTSDNHYNVRNKHHNRELLPKTLICLIAILSFFYFINTVINILHFIFFRYF